MHSGNDFANETGETQAEKINKFKEICDVDDETAIRLLQESVWNLEAAIHQFFYVDNQYPEADTNHENEINELIRQRNNRIRDVQSMPGEAPPVRSVRKQHPRLTWGQWFKALALIPFRFFYTSVAEIFGFLVSIFKPPSLQNRNQQALRNVENINMNRHLMRQQEFEYEQSLAIDRAKQLKKKDEEKQKRIENEVRLNAESLQQIKKQKIEALREKIRSEIPPEPANNTPNIVKIRINFPDGAKFDRYFDPDERIEQLFNAVFVHEACPDDFSLLSGYPRRELGCPSWYKEFTTQVIHKSTDATFKDEGLVQSNVVLVRNNDA